MLPAGPVVRGSPHLTAARGFGHSTTPRGAGLAPEDKDPLFSATAPTSPGKRKSKAAFSPGKKKKTFPQLPLWFRRVQGHQAPTHTRPCCLLCPGSWSRRSGTLPARTEQSRSAWARGQHRSSHSCGARCQHTGTLTRQPGSSTAPSPEPPCPSQHPQPWGRASFLTSALTATATASCAGSAASPEGEDGHGGTPDSRHARRDEPAHLPGRGATIDAGDVRDAAGITPGAAGTGRGVRPHTRADLLRLGRCAGVRVPGLPPGCSCSPG